MDRISSRWQINTGNATVTSALLYSGTDAAGIALPKMYNNSTLLPYVGQIGWVIEYPEYAQDRLNSDRVVRWVAIRVNATLLFKLLRADPGLHRARCTFAQTPGETALYSEAAVMEDQFRWDNSRIRATMSLNPNKKHRVEALVEADYSTSVRWVHAPDPDWSLDSQPYRLVEKLP